MFTTGCDSLFTLLHLIVVFTRIDMIFKVLELVENLFHFLVIDMFDNAFIRLVIDAFVVAYINQSLVFIFMPTYLRS